MVVNKIGTHKTNIIQEDGWTKVIYHGTVVVKFNDKQIVLNTGGFRTQTTKRRMNEASKTFNLGINVFQDHKEWYCSKPQDCQQFHGEELIINRS